MAVCIFEPFVFAPVFFSGNETNLHLCIVKSTTFEADCRFMLEAGVVSVRAFFICNVPNFQVTGAVRHLFFFTVLCDG